MKHGYLQNFRTLDPKAFEVFMRHLGFATAACYRVRGESLALVLSSEVEPATPWPVVMPYDSHYTASGSGLPPLGWRRPAGAAAARKDWPKGTNLYFPEQGLDERKVVIAVVSAPGKRVRAAELSGAIEAFCARIRQIVAADVERAVVSETGLEEHIKTLGIDLQMLLDHELRTPLASVSGYAALLRETNGEEAPELIEHWQVLETQLAYALAAVDKLSIALGNRGMHSVAREEHEDDKKPFDVAAMLSTMCNEVKGKAEDLVGSEAAVKTAVRFRKETDQALVVAASRRLFHWALWEVLKNAVIHSRSGRVDVTAYALNGTLVIDIADDGPGVSPGAEELVFLRFYQDPATQASRKGKRGLGLGLFLARHIAERHLGELTYVRQRGTSVFRFLWPLEAVEIVPGLSMGA